MKRVCFVCETPVDVEQIPLDRGMSPSISICDYCQQLDYNGEYLIEILEQILPNRRLDNMDSEREAAQAKVKLNIDMEDIRKIMDALERIRNPNVPYLTSQLGMANFAIELNAKEAFLIQEIINSYSPIL